MFALLHISLGERGPYFNHQKNNDNLTVSTRKSEKYIVLISFCHFINRRKKDRERERKNIYSKYSLHMHRTKKYFTNIRLSFVCKRTAINNFQSNN